MFIDKILLLVFSRISVISASDCDAAVLRSFFRLGSEVP